MKDQSDKKNIRVVTHDGSFHSDDIFSCASLSLLFERKNLPFELIRTRDESLISSGDYVFDVGVIYDEEKNRFDHHQRGGAGKRINGIEYASFGLVWKKIGVELSGSQEAFKIIDDRLVSPIDAFDNGVDLIDCKWGISPYLIEFAFSSMEPTWREIDLNKDEMFQKSVSIAKEILEREINHAKDNILAKQILASIYENSEDKRIIILDKNYPSDFLKKDFPESFFVVYPRSDGSWGTKTIRAEQNSFRNKKDFPVSWAGLRNEDIAKASGVPDAIFCHRALFMAVARSREGAIKLAELALTN